MTTMNYIGLDVHKKTISYCVKDVSGRIQQGGNVRSTRRELDWWMKTLPQPWTAAMEATIFSGWIYDHLLPHGTQIKVAHPLMLRAIAAVKKKNDQIDASKLADCLRCDFLPQCHMMPRAIRDRRRTLSTWPLRNHFDPPMAEANAEHGFDFVSIDCCLYALASLVTHSASSSEPNLWVIERLSSPLATE
jgi:hypothetical protein